MTGPYRAEHKKKKFFGVWRKNIEEAFADAKLLGNGALVVSSERVLLARFENAMRFASSERLGRLPKDEISLTRFATPDGVDEGVLDEDE